MAIFKHRGNPKASKKVGFVLLVIFLIAVIIIFSGIIWYKVSLRAVGQTCPTTSDSSDCKDDPINFEIASGETTTQIATSLQDKGIIKSSLAFNLYLKLERRSATLKSGKYLVKKSMKVAELVDIFNAGADAETFTITFLPGGTVMSAKTRLLKFGYTSEEIDAALKATYNQAMFATRPADSTVEGYIYGDTYNFFKTASVSDVLNKTFDQMEDVVEKDQLATKYQTQGLSLYQGITLASVVQRESGSLKSDMPQVAKVFLNRMRKGMTLGSDAIIAYRADQLNPNRDKNDLSYLKTIGCPWNSRTCTGLPPSPISNPGEAALQAVANPASGDYLFFLTGDDGKMYYANTYAEHEQNIKAHCQKLCQLL